MEKRTHRPWHSSGWTWIPGNT